MTAAELRVTLDAAGAISAVTVHASRDGCRRELAILAPASDAVRDITRPVAAAIGGRVAGVVG